MNIDVGNFITVGIFLAGLALSHIRTQSKMSSDGAVLREKMEHMQAKLTELGSVLVSLADVKGEMRLAQERGVAQANRVDEIQKWVNKQRDRAEARE